LPARISRPTNLTRANLTGATLAIGCGSSQGRQRDTDSGRLSRPALTQAVRHQTSYALTGLPYLPSGIGTGAS